MPLVIKNVFYYMAAFAGKIRGILCSDWLLSEGARWSYRASGFPVFVPQDRGLTTLVQSRYLDIGLCCFFKFQHRIRSP